ncbi:MAG: ATP-binding cassette domain-containing protein, partial [Filifactoraceae bacterium]
MGTVLECINLSKSYGKKSALKDISVKVESGKIVGVLGPNASGKTTFIKLANGLLTPSSGKILIDGHEPSVYTKEAVAYLPDKNYLNDWMKVSELVEFFEDFYSNFKSDRAYEMLENLNIDKNERLKTLSKGTKEKIQLILVMSRDAKLYMLDEPIAG